MFVYCVIQESRTLAHRLTYKEIDLQALLQQVERAASRPAQHDSISGYLYLGRCYSRWPRCFTYFGKFGGWWACVMYPYLPIERLSEVLQRGCFPRNQSETHPHFLSLHRHRSLRGIYNQPGPTDCLDDYFPTGATIRSLAPLNYDVNVCQVAPWSGKELFVYLFRSVPLRMSFRSY